MLPSRQAGLACNVFEKDGALFDETAGGDGTVLAVEYRGVCASGVDPANSGSLSAFPGLIGLCIGGVGVRRGGLWSAATRARDQQSAERDGCKPADGNRPGSGLNSVIPWDQRFGIRGRRNLEMPGNRREHGASTRVTSSPYTIWRQARLIQKMECCLNGGSRGCAGLRLHFGP